MVRSGPVHFKRHTGVGGTNPSASYARREPEHTVLYQVVKDHLRTFLAEARERSEHGFGLPGFVERELERYLECGLLCHGFARVRCDDCGHDVLVPLSCKNRGVCPSCTTRRMHDTAAHLVDRVLPRAPYRQWVLSVPRRVRFLLARDASLLGEVLRIFLRVVFAWQRRRARSRGIRGLCGSVTWVQRFGGHLNLNVHFHALVPDGVFARAADGSLHLHVLDPPGDADVAALTRRIVRRIRALLDPDRADDAPSDALGAAQATAVMALPPVDGDAEVRVGQHQSAFIEGFSLHAGTYVAANDRLGLERVARYAGRPPLALSRLTLTAAGKVAYRLKRPRKSGAPALVLTPLEFLGRLATLIPPPRRHLTRYHGVFAPNAAARAAVVPPAPDATDEAPSRTPGRVPATVLARRLDWAALLARVFTIDVLRCTACGGRRRVLAFLTDPTVVASVLVHLGLPSLPPPVAPARSPPPEVTTW